MKVLLLVVVLLCSSVQAATHYIRDGGTASTSGNGACTGWATANACDQLPTNLVRGDTYCIADGTYNVKTLNTPNLGTTLITIRKAVHNDGTCSAGPNWQSTFGDGQATWLGDWILGSDNWVLDGATRNENDWTSGSSYGFRITSLIASTSLTAGICGSNLTVRYVHAGGTPVGNPPTNGVDFAFKIAGFDEFCSGWTLSRMLVENTITTFHINGSTGGTLEFSYIRNGWSKESVRGQIAMSNWAIRHNIFKDSCQGNPADPTAGACTGIIALFDGGPWDNTKIYGNVFWNTNSVSVQDAIIVIGGTSETPTGGEIYNNTFAGIRNGALTILTRGSAACRNNLAYDLGPSGTTTLGFTCSAGASNNSTVGSNPFVNYSGGNFHLSAATAAGISLSSPYNVDMDGNTRGSDGVWDLGAYEFNSGSPPSEPINFRLSGFLWTAGLLGLLGGMMWRMRNALRNWRGAAHARSILLRPRHLSMGSRASRTVA